MAQALVQPTLVENETLQIDRSAEDYLDWVENHQRPAPTRSRVTGTLIGVAVTLTAATVAVVASVGL
jgi:hypothetical protein